MSFLAFARSNTFMTHYKKNKNMGMTATV